MQKLEFIMGMPVIIEMDFPQESVFEKAFDYFRYIDEKFSPYKADSEVTKLNDGRLKSNRLSHEMKLVLKLSEKTKKETEGYFDIERNSYIDPSGLVKGWAINNASKIIKKFRVKNYYINAGGDIQTSGLNSDGGKWAVGIRNPFNIHENVKIVYLSGEGIATSGIYEKGNHIYNPKDNTSHFKTRSFGPHKGVASRSFLKNAQHTYQIVSLTVIGPDVYEADRFATAAFAMGENGINFIDSLNGIEGYMIDAKGIATMTAGFEKYTYA